MHPLPSFTRGGGEEMNMKADEEERLRRTAWIPTQSPSEHVSLCVYCVLFPTLLLGIKTQKYHKPQRGGAVMCWEETENQARAFSKLFTLSGFVFFTAWRGTQSDNQTFGNWTDGKTHKMKKQWANRTDMDTRERQQHTHISTHTHLMH